MTIRELYEWAVRAGLESNEVRIQHRDNDYFYEGYDELELEGVTNGTDLASFNRTQYILL